jgi:(1->4)-alpha-D-glucan 1-alpha-D-glucosylmutase
MLPLPESTYRLQFHAGFTFRDAAVVVPYLHALGVTHCYASPYLRARPGSTHGYDVIDHGSLNPELGTGADYQAWLDAMARHGMSHVLDTVPNHVGVATNDNAWWNDVLEHGPASRYARHFDIAWRGSPRPELHDKVLLPVLGGHYGDVLERGELKVVHADGKFWVAYYDRRFPLSPRSVAELRPDRLSELNGTPGDPRSFDRLDALLQAQHYRLAYWRTASDEINYRRFFDINDLAALGMEHAEVFEATHRFTFELVEQGKVAGLRIDHPDGLYDPEQYVRRLRERRPGLYVLVEKILAPGEPLPTHWPVHGTSGYDFLNEANGLFIDTRHEGAFTELYQDWAGDDTRFEDLVYAKKKLILETSLASELQMLAHRLDRLAQRDRHSRDFTHRALRDALREVIACFPVYRSYVTARGVGDADRRHVGQAVDRAVARNPATEPAIFHFIREAVLQERGAPDGRAEWVEFAGRFQQLTAPVTAKGIEDTAFYIYNRFVSLNEVGGEPSRFGVSPEDLHAYLADRRRRWPYAMSALSTHDTKRSEDVRARLNVLSEMPDEWARHVRRWGEVNARHRRDLPRGPAPDRNEEYLIYQTLLGAWPLEPWSAAEYDAFVGRVQAYLVKAMREAKVRTSWTDPDAGHEQAVQDFVAALLDETRSGEFLADLRPLRQRVSHLGLINSLAQTLLRLAAPGVPDTYQGTELWDFSLVDPDNRRPVDYGKRREMLESLQRRISAAGDDLAPLARELFASKEDGRAKLLVTTRTLALRRAHPGLFSEGEYAPLRAAGSHARHVFALARRHGGRSAVVVVPRLIATLSGDARDVPTGPGAWGDTRLVLPGDADAALRDAFTGRRPTRRGDGSVALADVLADFPVALLVG